MLISTLSQLTTLAFWEGLLTSYIACGPLIAMGLATVESLIPALPLAAITMLNITGFGAFRGFLFTYMGSVFGCILVFSFFRLFHRGLKKRLPIKNETLKKAEDFVSGISPGTLFLILSMPFTPSSFVNLAFGLCDYPGKVYLFVLLIAKLFMIGSLALLGILFNGSVKDPRVIALLVPTLLLLIFFSKRINKKAGI